MTDEQRVYSLDARLAVLAVALEGPMALARVLRLSLDDVQSLVAIGYLREYQRRGHSLRMMTRPMQKSLRTLAAWSSRAQKEGPPLEGSQRIGLRRRIVRTLAVDGSTDRDQLAARLPKIATDELAEAIDDLCGQGIVADDEGRLELAAGHLDLAQADLDHRLESLRHFFGAVFGSVYQRFFTTEAPEVFARVFTFSVRPERLQAMRTRFYEELRAAVLDADAEAEGDGRGSVQASVTLTFAETPTDRGWQGL